jgi:hypothetical protein
VSAYRCNPCSTNWPASVKVADVTETFNPCPECDGKTDFLSNATPIEDTEAISRKRHADFERWYADREAKRLAADLEHVEGGPC